MEFTNNPKEQNQDNSIIDSEERISDDQTNALVGGSSRTGYLVPAFWNRGIANSYSKWRVFGQYGDHKKPQGLDPWSLLWS